MLIPSSVEDDSSGYGSETTPSEAVQTQPSVEEKPAELPPSTSTETGETTSQSATATAAAKQVTIRHNQSTKKKKRMTESEIITELSKYRISRCYIFQSTQSASL